MSPPAWGWPGLALRVPACLQDVPTRVGMARHFGMSFPSCERCPHPRGDGPTGGLTCRTRSKMSPPAWGWPDRFITTDDVFSDVPTRVGMARKFFAPARYSRRCPHPRGDGPQRGILRQVMVWMSPPAWGWPVGIRWRARLSADVPTRVGMARGWGVF